MTVYNMNFLEVFFVSAQLINHLQSDNINHVIAGTAVHVGYITDYVQSQLLNGYYEYISGYV